jgi:autotransporter-associated beta strand protein
MAAVPAWADSSGWNVDAASTWSTPGNWDNGVPGIAAGTTSTDIATFGFTLSATRIVTVDANRNIGGITFSNTSTFGYSLNSGSIRLTNGGVIQNTADTGNHTETILSPIQIQGDGGSATFTGNATSNTSLLNINSDITGVSTAPNFTTLTLNGTNVGSSAGVNALSDSVTGRITVVKDGEGRWHMNNGNSYSGGTIVKQGTIFGNFATSFGTGTITIGDSVANDNDATVGISAATVTNNFIIAAGSTGTLSLLGSLYTGTPGDSILSGNIALGNNLTVGQIRSSNTRMLTLSGVITGGGTITVIGPDSAIATSGANGNSMTVISNAGNATAFTGDIVLNGGSLRFSDGSIGNGIVGQGDGKITFTGAAGLQWAAGNTQDLSAKIIESVGTVGTLDIGANNVTFGTTNGLTGTGGFTRQAGSAGILTLLAANNFSGTYTANAAGGATVLKHQNALGGATVVPNGTVQFHADGGSAFTFGNLSGAGALSLNNGVADVTLTVGGNNSSPVAAYSGLITGGGSVIKVGTGTTQFNGANTFTGGLTIKEGTFIAGVANATTVSGAAGPSTVAINLGDSTGSASATLLSNVNNAISNNLNLGATSGTVAIGNTGSISVNFSGNVALNGRDLTILRGGGGSVIMNGTLNGTGNLIVSSTSGLAGNVTLGAVVGSNVGSVTVNAANTTLGLGNLAHAFAGGLNIREGTVTGGSSPNAFGANTNIITLGTANSTLAATLSSNSSQNYPQAITTANNAGSNLLIIATGGNGNYSGGLTLNNSSVNVQYNGIGTMTVSGPVGGTGGVTAIANGTGALTFSNTVNNNGDFTSQSPGTGNVNITGALGAAVDELIQETSTASVLSIQNANAAFTGVTRVKEGTLRTSAAATLGSGDAFVESGGILELLGSNTISNTAALTIDLGGSIKLNFAAANLESVNALTLDGVSIAYGTVFNQDNNWGGYGNVSGFFAGSTGGLAVPEPGSLSLVGLGLMTLLKRRRAR